MNKLSIKDKIIDFITNVVIWVVLFYFIVYIALSILVFFIKIIDI